MSTIDIKVKDVMPGMIITDNDEVTLVVSDVWPDQGPGLGIMVKGRVIADARDYEQRFFNVEETLARTIDGNPKDVMNGVVTGDE
jgi:hypothetical protein